MSVKRCSGSVLFCPFGLRRFPVWRGCSNVAMRDYPLVAVDIHDVVCCQVLHVNEREGGEAHKDEDVTHEGQIVVLELMGYDCL